MSDAPLLRLPVHRAVLRVAWPMAVLGVLTTGYYLTDAWFVGLLGGQSLAALGGASFGSWMVHAAGLGVAVGVTARVARYEGAGQRERVRGALTQGLWLATGVAVALGTVGLALVPLYFSLLGFEPGSEAWRLGASYLGTLAATGSGVVLLETALGAYRGLGWTRTALLITGVALLANAFLDPLLIFGWGPVPALGIAGAAVATSLGNLLGAGLALRLLAREGLHPRVAGPVWHEVRLLASIGAPMAATSIAFSAVYVLLGDVVTRFGEAPMAALGVGHRIEGIAYHLCVACGVGASTLVGQNLGAGRPLEAARSAHVAAWLAAAAMVPLGLLVAAGAPWVFGVFTDEPAIVQHGTVYLRWQAAIWATMALEVVYEGAFSGSGHTRPALAIMGVGTAARLPLAYVLAGTPLGVDGVWIAIALTTGVKGVAMLLWFLRGRWQAALPGDASEPAPA